MNNLPENDTIALNYIAIKTGRFTESDVYEYSKNCSNKEILAIRTLTSTMADYDYDFEDSYVQIQLSQLVEMILF